MIWEGEKCFATRYNLSMKCVNSSSSSIITTTTTKTAKRADKKILWFEREREKRTKWRVVLWEGYQKYLNEFGVCVCVQNRARERKETGYFFLFTVDESLSLCLPSGEIIINRLTTTLTGLALFRKEKKKNKHKSEVKLRGTSRYVQAPTNFKKR